VLEDVPDRLLELLAAFLSRHPLPH
jgi:hypothetical protein